MHGIISMEVEGMEGYCKRNGGHLIWMLHFEKFILWDRE